MRKIKFKTEYVPLSDEVINSHKNFDQLLSAYVAAPKPNWFKQFIQKKWTMFGGGLMTGAIITSILWYNQETLFVKETIVQESPPSSERQFRTEDQSAVLVDTVQVIAPDADNQDQPKETDLTFDHSIRSATFPLSDIQANDVVQNANAIKQQSVPGDNSITEVQSDAMESAKSHAVTIDHPNLLAIEKELPDVNPADEAAHMHDQQTSTDATLFQEDIALVQTEELVAGESSVITTGVIDTHMLPVSVQEVVAEESETKLSFTDTTQAGADAKTKDGNLLPGALAGAAIIAAPSAGDKSAAGKNKNSNKSEKKKSDTKEIKTPDTAGDITVFNTDSLKDNASLEKKKGWFDFGNDSSKTAKTTHGMKMDSMRGDGKSPEQLSADSLYVPRYAQVSFVTPLSSNGIDGYKYMHYFSLNILQGYNGAVEGAEFGGLLNGVKGYVTGAQFGGLANFAGGNLKGAQFGGLANVTGGSVKGAQFGGLANVGETLKGAQFAGIANISSGYVTGFQAAGITNISADSLNGAQVAGIVNILSSEKESAGWQVAGIGNVSLADTKGGQIGGVFNVANRMVGAQISLINFGQNVDGVQIGLINISDTLKGAAIGLVSVSSDGVFDVALWTSDFLMFNGGIRVGTKSVYNIYAYGVSPFQTELPFGFGIGIGGHIPVKKKAFIEIDGMAWSMHRSYVSFDEINMINQLRVMGGYRFNKYFSVFAGPTFNVSVQSNRYEPFLDNYFYESVSENNTVRLAPGFVAGVRLF